MKVLHTADWHIGQFKGPVEDGVNLRSGKAHPWHLVTENWGQTHVWGWVDEGSFD